MSERAYLPVSEALWRDPENLGRAVQHFREKMPDQDLQFFPLLEGQSVEEALQSARAVDNA